MKKDKTYMEWEKRLKEKEKEEWAALCKLAKIFGKRWKKPVFVVNRDLRKKKV